ncbi:MAG: pilus assembly protein [endosymbiont of Galathealinum brachiosum]|uniref:Pilus assembly protein n=1 Tax=endosymbiont of Galathealinum brachiosum TaxID=2200906 RepID=A0A370DIC1_9GAMM|nr:MAG: pilus assembly protein [endosymbiont of Galathealinum brachiosum]
MEILKRDSLNEGGFAGLREHRLIKEPELFGPQANIDGSWPGKINGLGNFIYLADARFKPHGETHMHSHHEVDVISVMVDGNISHEGSLEHGKNLTKNDVQIQRAGGEGFSHNEVNPDDDWNRLIQLWVLPEVAGQPTDYKVYTPLTGELTRIYGGDENDKADFPAKTKLDIAVLRNEQQIEVNKPFLAYITRGNGLLNGESVVDGDLIRGESIKFKAQSDTQLIIIHFE